MLTEVVEDADTGIPKSLKKERPLFRGTIPCIATEGDGKYQPSLPETQTSRSLGFLWHAEKKSLSACAALGSLGILKHSYQHLDYY
jgi:hypothetical protein